MKRLGLMGLLGAVLLGCWEPGDAIRCFDKQYEHKGRCCNRCQPGEKLVSECNGTEDSVCTRCESGHYQHSWTKEKHCAPHDICEDNAGLIVKTQGNATHNTVCQCRDGMHCSDTSCQTCVENQPCQRGFGFVAAKAVARISSPCEPCAEGTFSNVSSKTEPCHPWTSCEEKGLVVKAKGTNTSDVICGIPTRLGLEQRQLGALGISVGASHGCLTDPISLSRVEQALLAVSTDPHHGCGRHVPRGHLHLLPGTHRSQATGAEADRRREAQRDLGGPAACGGGGGPPPCARDPAWGPACGPGGWQGEPHLGAGEAVRVQGTASDRSTD